MTSRAACGSTLLAGGGVLKVDGLTKRYGALTAIRDLSFTVQPGEVLGLLPAPQGDELLDLVGRGARSGWADQP